MRRPAEAILVAALALGCGAQGDPIVVGVAGPFREARGASMRLAAKLRRAFTGRWWDYLASVGRGGGRPAYGGVTGRIAFDSLGDVPTKPVLIAVVHGGRLVTEWQP